jgi:hypothetical protein
MKSKNTKIDDIMIYMNYLLDANPATTLIPERVVVLSWGSPRCNTLGAITTTASKKPHQLGWDAVFMISNEDLIPNSNALLCHDHNAIWRMVEEEAALQLVVVVYPGRLAGLVAPGSPASNLGDRRIS